jgi:NAD(P)-dependent dehydrogenase (short-subunit alcohol dehydrogenase family)
MSAEPLAGRVALVTGASRGIGKAIAEQLAAAGARVVCAARSTQAIAELAAALPGEGHVALTMDVGQREAIDAALAQLASEVGPVDVLVANAGIAESAPFERTEDEAWERMMSVNATSVFRLCRALVPKMIESGWGRVVVVASNAALVGYHYSSAYCASKHAVLGFMRAMALEVAKSAVTVNAVCPGWVDTDMAAEAVARIADKTGKSSAEAKRALERMSPQQRMVTPAEVASLVSYLCHPDAGSIHGQALAVDGGQVMR